MEHGRTLRLGPIGMAGALLLFLGLPGHAVEPSRGVELATPGFCAEARKAPAGPPESEAVEEERGGSGSPADSGSEEGAGGDSADPVAGLPRTRFDPVSVAAGPPVPGLAAPLTPATPRPGPCDDPGSGCLGTVQPAPAATEVPPAPTSVPRLKFETGPAPSP